MISASHHPSFKNQSYPHCFSSSVSSSIPFLAVFLWSLKLFSLHFFLCLWPISFSASVGTFSSSSLSFISSSSSTFSCSSFSYPLVHYAAWLIIQHRHARKHPIVQRPSSTLPMRVGHCDMNYDFNACVYQFVRLTLRLVSFIFNQPFLHHRICLPFPLLPFRSITTSFIILFSFGMLP